MVWLKPVLGHSLPPNQSAVVALPDTLDVERWWGFVFLLLAACEPEPRGPTQVILPEAMRFDTEHIRNEVDRYRTQPSTANRQRMEREFAALDAKVRNLESLAQTQTGLEQASTEQQIADLKHRRELHWARAQTALAQTESVKKAEQVGERVMKAERVNGSQRSRRTSDASRTANSQRAARMAEPRSAPPNFFQRLFR